jgi:hypothetical protein
LSFILSWVNQHFWVFILDVEFDLDSYPKIHPNATPTITKKLVTQYWVRNQKKS